MNVRTAAGVGPVSQDGPVEGGDVAPGMGRVGDRLEGEGGVTHMHYRVQR